MTSQEAFREITHFCRNVRFTTNIEESARLVEMLNIVGKQLECICQCDCPNCHGCKGCDCLCHTKSETSSK
jgi:hypothetical protein